METLIPSTTPTRPNSILKVKTLEMSLLSCRSSMLKRLSKSVRSLVKEASSRSIGLVKQMSTGSLFGNGSDDVDDNRSTAITEPSSTLHSSINIENRSIKFADVRFRVYQIAPDDSPCTSKGAGITLSGWKFQEKAPISVESYEETKPPRRKMEEMKLSLTERTTRLLESGATAREIALYARRAKEAKAQLMKTTNQLKVHGAQHLAREEKKEVIKHMFQRALGIRKCETKEQKALWKKVETYQPKQTPSLDTGSLSQRDRFSHVKDSLSRRGSSHVKESEEFEA